MTDSDPTKSSLFNPDQIPQKSPLNRREVLKYAWTTPAVISAGGISTFGGGISGSYKNKHHGRVYGERRRRGQR